MKNRDNIITNNINDVIDLILESCRRYIDADILDSIFNDVGYYSINGRSSILRAVQEDIKNDN